MINDNDECCCCTCTRKKLCIFCLQKQAAAMQAEQLSNARRSSITLWSPGAQVKKEIKANKRAINKQDQLKLAACMPICLGV